jgi:hypothetical protein
MPMRHTDTHHTSAQLSTAAAAAATAYGRMMIPKYCQPQSHL